MNLEELYGRYGENLYRYLLFRLGSPEDAEDVLQETFCRFARYAVRWRLVRNPQAFVFGVARNEVNRFLRRKLSLPAGNPPLFDRACSFSAALAAPAEPSALILVELADRLPEEQKEVIFMKVFDGLTFKEIGSACGISANTAASRYRYALDKLRAALEETR
ncbi:MAG: sigma-70 family RNA polymerase sigma factor [Candidatus Aminicenantes bacterium]|nr:sigma-70 family RNA polymerase sigma factor [Candidatus Aminicenantes bacterium]